jgi:hypothetical protein
MNGKWENPIMFKGDRYNSLYIIRITSDTLTNVDDRMIPMEVTGALEAGLRSIVFSVTVGSLANQVRISSILLKCKEIAGMFNAHLMFVEKNNGKRGIYGSLCNAMQIPLYTIVGEESPAIRLYNKNADDTDYL